MDERNVVYIFPIFQENHNELILLSPNNLVYDVIECSSTPFFFFGTLLWNGGRKVWWELLAREGGKVEQQSSSRKLCRVLVRKAWPNAGKMALYKLSDDVSLHLCHRQFSVRDRPNLLLSFDSISTLIFSPPVTRKRRRRYA